MPGRGSGFGIVAVGAAMIMSLGVLWHFVQGNAPYAPPGYEWFSIGSLHFELGIYVDGLTAAMLVVVTTISLMVHIYSLGYMHGDTRFTWFYFVLSVFTSAMLTVVISNNLIELLIGWEVMGVCSYLLIGHWYEEKQNSNAAIKAFITTRIGDIPFMFGIIMLIAATGFTTSNIVGVTEAISEPAISALFVSMAAILLFGGTIGKSAQFPSARVAPRRDGRSDARLGADPRGHDGRGRRLPRGTSVRGLPARGAVGAHDREHHRGDHDPGRGAARDRAGRHQARARVLDALAALLHGGGSLDG